MQQVLKQSNDKLKEHNLIERTEMCFLAKGKVPVPCERKLKKKVEKG